MKRIRKERTPLRIGGDILFLLLLHEVLGYILVRYRLIEEILGSGANGGEWMLMLVVAYFLVRMSVFFLLPGWALGQAILFVLRRRERGQLAGAEDAQV